MSESEAIEAINLVGANGATYFTLFITFTFAYLTAAFFVGALLTRFQCVVLSSIYLVSEFFMGASTMVYAEAFTELTRRETTVMNTSWLSNAINWPTGLSIILVVTVVVSLYFMYDIRKKPKMAASTNKQL